MPCIQHIAPNNIAKSIAKKCIQDMAAKDVKCMTGTA